jgi:hypothetical protein
MAMMFSWAIFSSNKLLRDYAQQRRKGQATGIAVCSYDKKEQIFNEKSALYLTNLSPNHVDHADDKCNNTPGGQALIHIPQQIVEMFGIPTCKAGSPDGCGNKSCDI